MLRLFGGSMGRSSCLTATALGLQRFASYEARPKYEFSEVNDDPSKGYMVRVVQDEKRVVLTHYPQLGPRKSDPMDPAPQFDFAARRAIRLFQQDVAAVLTVCEGRATKQRLDKFNHDLVFEKDAEGRYSLSGTVGKRQNPTQWGMQFEGYQATMLHNFLRSALDESFGFRQHFRFLEEDSKNRYNKQVAQESKGGADRNSRSPNRQAGGRTYSGDNSNNSGNYGNRNNNYNRTGYDQNSQ